MRTKRFRGKLGIANAPTLRHFEPNPDNEFTVIAMVLIGNSVIAISNNSGFQHAEHNVIEITKRELQRLGRAKINRLKGRLTLHVTRFRFDGTATMARPCQCCTRLIQVSYLFSRVIWTDWDGNVVQQHPNNLENTHRSRFQIKNNQR